MFAACRRQIVLWLMLVALPAAATAQAPTLSSQVPGPGESSSISTIEGGEKTTTSCRTDTQRNTVCVNRSYPIARPPEPAPLLPPVNAFNSNGNGTGAIQISRRRRSLCPV